MIARLIIFLAQFVPLLSAHLIAQTTVPKDDAALRHAIEILQSTPLIDGHNDLPWAIREYKIAPMNVDAYDALNHPSGDTDLQRLKEGHVGAQFWSVYVPGEIKEGYARVQLEQIDIARQLIERYPDRLTLALSADDIESIFKQGRIASLIGMEGGHAIENSLGALRAYYALGARYLTLTHNVTLAWADAALDKAKHHGLTRFGKEVVREMNRLGMLVDLSHVSPEVMSDALAISEAPVIFSHSCARALVDHPRNVPDSILSRLSINGGVIMVTFVPSFVSKKSAVWSTPLSKLLKRAQGKEADGIRSRYIAAHGPEPKATLSDVADHIDHIRAVAGSDHIGIGGDLGMGDGMPVGLEDVSKYPQLFAELIRRGWTDADLRKLAGENILRVFRSAEATAARLQKLRPASTETIKALDGLK